MLKAIKEFGGFAISLSGLIEEVISFFRIIQRCSATIEFKTKISPEAKKLFEWAPDFMGLIFNDIIPLEHLTELDTLILLGFGFYLAFAFLFFAIFKSSGSSFLGIFTAAFLVMIGCGISYIPEKKGWWLTFGFLLVIPVSITLVLCGIEIGILLLFPLYFLYTNFKKIFKMDSSDNEIDFMDINIGTWIATLIFGIVCVPVFMKKDGFSITYFTVTAIIDIGICFITYKFDEEKIIKFISIGYQIISTILVIPIISNLVEVNKSTIGLRWQIMTFVIIVPIISTLFLNIALVFQRYGKIVNDYKNRYHYFEILDLLVKYIYAFFCAYEITWGSIAVEIVFLIAIIAVRPYNEYHKYTSAIGEAVVVILANFISKFYKGTFSISISIFILCIGALPIIISLYVYFIFDFGKEKPVESEIKPLIINILLVILIPVGFLCYGFCIPILYNNK